MVLKRFATGASLVRMGDEGGLFTVLISAFVTPGGRMYGELGEGDGLTMAVILRFFVPRRSLFFKMREGEGGKNKVGPKKLQLVLELIECGGLAIGKTRQSGHSNK